MKINLAGVQETLLLTLYAKALDSQSNHPILGDQKSVEIVQQLDYDFKKLRLPAKEAFGGAIRTRIMDDCIREFLASHPNAAVLDLGCGLDDRAGRIQPGSGVWWFDVDYPDVIAVRKHFFTEWGGRHMIAHSLADTDFLNDVPADRPAIIVADGLLPFLTEAEMVKLFKRLTDHFQTGEMVLNSYTHKASRLLAYHPSIRAIGLKAQNPGFDDPRQPEAWAPRLKFIAEYSIVGSPYVAKTPWSYRSICWLMYNIPALRREGGWVLRYQF